MFLYVIYLHYQNDSEVFAVQLNNGKVNHYIDDTDYVMIVDTELNIVNLPF